MQATIFFREDKASIYFEQPEKTSSLNELTMATDVHGGNTFLFIKLTDQQLLTLKAEVDKQVALRAGVNLIKSKMLSKEA